MLTSAESASVESAARTEAKGVDSRAVYGAFATGTLGAVMGVIIGVARPPLPLAGSWTALGSIVALASGIVAATAAGLGYWRVRDRAGENLSAWTVFMNTTAVIVVHAFLAVIATLAIFQVLSLGLIGLLVPPFWTTVAMAVTLGLTVNLVYPSVSRMTTQRMSTLLMTFVGIGTLTAMVTTTDPAWWTIHFSHLGTFWSISGLVFNGTLVIGGVLVSAFGFHLANDIQQLVTDGVLPSTSVRFVRTSFLVMGIMLAGVGLVPVNVNLVIHNLFAAGLAVVYLALLLGGPRVLRGMPRAYFIASAGFLIALVVSIVAFAVAYFNTTAFEIVVFALVFGWISVFNRFLGEAGSTQEALSASSPDDDSSGYAEELG